MAGVDDEVAALAPTDVPDDAWSVAELNAEIEAVLASASDRFPTCVVGEIAAVNHYPYWTFFELSDVEGEETISCRSILRRVRARNPGGGMAVRASPRDPASTDAVVTTPVTVTDGRRVVLTFASIPSGGEGCESRVSRRETHMTKRI